MSDFSDALQARLSSNDELAQQREEAEAEMARAEAAAEREREAQKAARADHHKALSGHLKSVAEQLKASRPDSFIVRSGWTDTGEEFIVKMSTRQMQPKRTLFLEVDHDDDEVLARWTSEVGNAIEIWRLMDVTPDMLTEMVLQVADDALWRAGRPPGFPGRGE